MVELYTIDKFVEGIESLLRKTLDDLGASRGSVMVVDRKKGELKIKVALADGASRSLDTSIIADSRAKLGESISGMVAETKEPLLINDIEDLRKRFPKLKTQTDSARYESSLVVPVVENDVAVAVLNINDKKGGGKFTEDNLKLAMMLAEYCAVALKLERMNDGILHVNEIIREISLTNDLPEVYRLVVSRGAEILDCAEASLMLVDKHEDGSFHLVVKESTDNSIIGE
ncbi:MAG TPA: GAF domain-containing protein, partial [Nitrospirota bacterium]